MKKRIILFALPLILLGVIAQALYANAGRKFVTTTEIPEGIILVEVEEEAVANPPLSSELISDTYTRVEIETIVVPEGIISIETEITGPPLSSAEKTSAERGAYLQRFGAMFVRMQQGEDISQEYEDLHRTLSPNIVDN